MKNEEVASLLYEIADYLEMQDVEYKPRAYRTAARNVERLSADVEDLHERGDLREIDGVGESIAEKIAEYLETGELEYLAELKADLELDVEALTSVRGVGPKTARKLYKEVGVTDLDDLEEAAEAGEIAAVEGFGEKTERNVLEHIELARRGQERTLIGKAWSRAEDVEQRLDDAPAFDRVQVVGSFRRRRPTVGDVDVLATAEDAPAAMDAFAGFEDVEEVIAKGETKTSVVLPGDLRVDLRIVEEVSWGAALLYFTGSKDHNITVRDRAQDRDWKLNEYGLFDVSEAPRAPESRTESGDVEEEQAGKRAGASVSEANGGSSEPRSDGDRLASETEEAVYDELGLDWIPPELREDTGEVEAAAEGTLPDLVETGDVRGDLQMHTPYSDGDDSLAAMAAAADERGHEYVLVTDHGPDIAVTGGVEGDRFEDQREDVDDVNDDPDIGVEVLHGVEAEVREGGDLDVSGEWCDRLDMVVAACHEPPENPTDAVVAAFESYPIDVFAHPTNRRINEREPIDYDFGRLVDAAAEEGVAFEINAQPERLDLDWSLVEQFRDDLQFVVSTDAHSTEELDFMHLGVAQARRGWLEADDILNTRPLEALDV